MELYLNELSQIEHYKKYPNLIPWIGNAYKQSKNKVLILGESHYLDKNSSYHHEPTKWYEGIDVTDAKDLSWMRTATIIQNGINNGWKEKSKLIYKNLSKALVESKVDEFNVEQPFHKICYLNYFQRPAEVTGKSINASELDSKVSCAVVNNVIDIVEPNIVVFSSTLAWGHAKKSGLINELKRQGIKCVRVPHAGMPWWNRVSKKYGNKTGKHYFIDFMKEATIN